MKRGKAAFLGRDGTIIVDSGYLRAPSGVSLLPRVGTALAELARIGYEIVVISNQSGVGRGFMTPDEVEAVNQRMETLLEESGAQAPSTTARTFPKTDATAASRSRGC